MLIYIKIVLISTFSLFLVACDSSEYMVITTGSTVAGVVVDGYIDGATVCADKNNNSQCDINESKTISKSNGQFILDNVIVERDSTINIIAYDGNDTATGKKLVGQLRTTITDTQLSNPIVISPITDLVTNSFLNRDINSSLNLEDIQQNIADILAISLEDINKDPLTDTTLFIKTQEIQHAKNILQKIVEKYLDANSTNTILLQEDIKENLIGYKLNLEQSLIALEAQNTISIPSNDKNFVIEQFEELKKALQNSSKNIETNEKNLNNIQKVIDEQQEKAIEKLLDNNNSDIIEIVKIDITSIEIDKDPFHSSDAILDQQACSEENAYSKISNSDKALSSDDANGISLASQYTDITNIADPMVSMYYPNLESPLSNEIIVIFKEHYYFQFDKNWIYNKNKFIYIQTPKNGNIEASCYRFELNSKLPNKIDGVKVYRQSKS